MKTLKDSKVNKLRAREFVVLLSAFTALTLASCAKPLATSAVDVGTSDTGIIGGADATGTEDFSTSIVALYNVKSTALCTASIVSDSLLVTAAHCVDGSATDMAVIFGTSLNDESKQPLVRRVVAYKTSPLWAFRQNEETNSGDIAMVRFAGGLPPGYKPAQILTDAKALQLGTTVTLAGYGWSDGVKHSGSGTLRSVEVKIENPAYSDSEVLLGQHDGKGACHGDSGGPAYVKVNGQLMLWGVTNRGVNDPNNDCSVSSAYASVVYYKDWLKQTATDLASAPVPQPRARTTASTSR